MDKKLKDTSFTRGLFSFLVSFQTNDISTKLKIVSLDVNPEYLGAKLSNFCL